MTTPGTIIPCKPSVYISLLRDRVINSTQQPYLPKSQAILVTGLNEVQTAALASSASLGIVDTQDLCE